MVLCFTERNTLEYIQRRYAQGVQYIVAERGTEMFQVLKRDGEVADFNLNKIGDAIAKAFSATNKHYSKEIIDLLALRVTANFQGKINNEGIHVEDIQDAVEVTLEQAGYTDVAKAYILYRKQREKIRNMKSTILDYKEIVTAM